MKGVLLQLIRGYQAAISPMLGVACRYEPSCSQYAHEAIERHGARRGIMLAVRRLARCRPGGGEGYDPVPPATRTSTTSSSALPPNRTTIAARTGDPTTRAASPTIDTSTH